jgi:hypothetical protein
MSRLLAVLLLCCFVEVAAASQLDEFLEGLDVHVESPPGQIYVNGLRLQFVRVTGVDAGLVAGRILSRWRAESGIEPLQSQAVGPWLVHSRLNDGASQVLQERTVDGETEMLWSIASPKLDLKAVPRPVVALPAGCIPGQTVHGNDGQASFVQFTAACSGGAQATLHHLRGLVLNHGYLLSRSGDASFEAIRGGDQFEAQIVASGERQSPARSFGLVILQRSARGVSR